LRKREGKKVLVRINGGFWRRRKIMDLERIWRRGLV